MILIVVPKTLVEVVVGERDSQVPSYHQKVEKKNGRSQTDAGRVG